MSNAIEDVDPAAGLLGSWAVGMRGGVLPEVAHTKVIDVKEFEELIQKSLQAFVEANQAKKLGQWIRKEIKKDVEVALKQRVKAQEIFKRFLALKTFGRYTSRDGIAWKYTASAHPMYRARGG